MIVAKHSVQGNGGRKKGAAEKENGVETLTGGAGDENLLKRGGVRSNSSIALLTLTILINVFTGQESKHCRVQRYYNIWKLTVPHQEPRKSQPAAHQPSQTESSRWSRSLKWCSMYLRLPKLWRTIWDCLPRKLGREAEWFGLLQRLWIRCHIAENSPVDIIL